MNEQMSFFEEETKPPIENSSEEPKTTEKSAAPLSDADKGFKGHEQWRKQFRKDRTGEPLEN